MAPTSATYRKGKYEDEFEDVMRRHTLQSKKITAAAISPLLPPAGNEYYSGSFIFVSALFYIVCVCLRFYIKTVCNELTA